MTLPQSDIEDGEGMEFFHGEEVEQDADIVIKSRGDRVQGFLCCLFRQSPSNHAFSLQCLQQRPGALSPFFSHFRVSDHYLILRVRALFASHFLWSRHTALHAKLSRVLSSSCLQVRPIPNHFPRQLCRLCLAMETSQGGHYLKPGFRMASDIWHPSLAWGDPLRIPM
jgi:hypothetical protein